MYDRASPVTRLIRDVHLVSPSQTKEDARAGSDGNVAPWAQHHKLKRNGLFGCVTPNIKEWVSR
jgi:hypothetical protein